MAEVPEKRGDLAVIVPEIAPEMVAAGAMELMNSPFYTGMPDAAEDLVADIYRAMRTAAR